MGLGVACVGRQNHFNKYPTSTLVPPSSAKILPLTLSVLTIRIKTKKFGSQAGQPKGALCQVPGLHGALPGGAPI